MGVAQNYTGGVTRVLVHVSTYQGAILEFRFFEPRPHAKEVRHGHVAQGTRPLSSAFAMAKFLPAENSERT